LAIIRPILITQGHYVWLIVDAGLQILSESTQLLLVKDLFCERDDRILFQNLSFSVSAGQVIQVKGSNGSGKTTLLRILCGLNDCFEGEIYFHGAKVEDQAEEYFASLLYIGHRIGVNKTLTPLENLAWSSSLHTQVSEDQLLAALTKVGLLGFEYSQCFSLSAGQQQRVSLARLLISPAKLWVLDEPFTTLDVTGVALLESMLAKHACNGGSVLVTTHHALKIEGLEELNLG
jgi:heme exporter protein A